jgi:hypothetical protein
MPSKHVRARHRVSLCEVAPSGTSAVVGLLADGAWGDGSAGGQSSQVTVTYPTEPCATPGTGRFTGGGFQNRVDSVRVTRGLTIHCDLLLSNNLEINWTGNQFPPDAPLDTLIGVGTGRYNGQDGFTVQFTLRDYGESGQCGAEHSAAASGRRDTATCLPIRAEPVRSRCSSRCVVGSYRSIEISCAKCSFTGNEVHKKVQNEELCAVHCHAAGAPNLRKCTRHCEGGERFRAGQGEFV